MSTTKTILLVEDEAFIALSEKHLLEREGYRVLVATSGEKAVNLVCEKREPVDLILMDVNLGPGIDGTEAGQQILQAHDIPIVFLTAQTEKEIIEKTEAITSYGYVDKTSSSNVLLASLKMAFKLHQAQLQLRVSEAKYHTLFEAAPDPILIINLDGVILDANPATTTLSGHPKEAILGKSFCTAGCLAAAQVCRLDGLLARIAAGEKLTPETFPVQTDTGETRWLELSFSLTNQPENSQAIQVVIHDLTNIQRVEAELRQSEQLLKEAQQIAHLGHWHWELVNNRLTWSDEIFHIFGVDPQQFKVTAENFEKTIHPDDLAAFLQARNQMLAAGSETEIPHRIIRPDGEVRHVVERARPLRDSTGNILAVTGIVQDVTERTQDEQNRLETEKLYYQMFNQHSAVNLLINPVDGAIVAANPAAAEFYGYPIETLQTLNIDQINPLPRATILAEMHLTEQHNRNHFMFQHRLASGELRDVEIYSTPLQVSGRMLLYSIIHDITDRKQMETLLAEQREKLEYILHGTNAGTWEWNVQTGETRFNERWAEIIGYTLAEISPVSIETWIHFAHPEDLRRSEEHLKQHFAGQLDYYECEIRMRHKDGNWVWVLDRGKVASWTEAGQPLLMFGTHQDITAKKQSEQALRQSENNFATFFNSVDDLLFVLNSEGRIIKANDTACQRLQYTEAELIGQHVLQVHPPERRAEAGQIVIDMLAGRRRECPVPLMAKDHHLIEVETYITRGRWNGQEALFGVTKDLSALKRSEEKFAKAFRMNSALMALSTLETGIYIDINEAFCATLGFQREEVLGKTATELGIFQENAQREAMLNIFKINGSLHNQPVTISDHAGRPHEGLFSAEQIEYASAPHLLTTFFDITEVRQLERELAAQRDFATQIINLMGQGLTVTNAEGCFEFVNPAYAHLFGYETADLMGKRPEDVTLPEQHDLLDEQRQLRRSGRTTSYETTLQRADGSTAPVLITAVPREQGGQYAGAIAVITDLTEQKRVEAQVRGLLREKEILLREVHHRIKNNMSAIISLLNLQMNTQDDPIARQTLQDASGRIRSMMVLYDKLYRSENFGTVPLQEYIPALLAEIMALFPQREKIALETKVAEIYLPPKILSPLGIILNELASNALKYAFPGARAGIIRVTATQTDRQVELSFTDDGIGLPEGFTITSSPGFGMQLVEILIHQLNGEIRYENQGGACFFMTFPIE